MEHTENKRPNEVEVTSKGRIIQCRLIFGGDEPDLIIEIPLPVAVALHKKLDLSILSVIENYSRL